MLVRNNFLMEEANGGEGAGGSGGILGDDGGQGTGTGGTGDGGSGGASGTGTGQGDAGGSGTGGGQGAPTVQIPENWQEILPSEIRDQANLRNFKTVDALAKAYIHSQKMVGADKIAIPKNASDTELREIFERLGLPKEAEKYDVKLENAVLDEKFTASFKEAAFKAGVMPNQAKQLLEFYNQNTKASQDSLVLAQKTKFEQNMNQIKEEWGEAYQENASRAKAALKEFTENEADAAYIRQNFGADPVVLRLLSKVGATLAEDKIKGEGGTGSNVLTPSQALARIGEIKSNIKGAYFDANHSDHAATKAEVSRLYKLAHPNKK